MTTRRVLTIATVLLGGCATPPPAPSGPYAPPGEADRNAARADELTQQAVGIAGADPGEAEALLRQALTADLYCGPAHNDLGVLYWREGKLYEAANEFEWARKLMPGHPDPRLNLALVLEKAGHTAEACTAYEAALEVAPEHVPTMQAYARLAVRDGRRDEKVVALLKSIALRGDDAAWREWASGQLAVSAGLKQPGEIPR